MSEQHFEHISGKSKPSAGKLDWIMRHCVHAIATGRWPVGHRLPSVREAESLWGLGRLTVLKAYQMLAEQGLVRSETRSGFFVAAGPRVDRVSRHRAELDRLFESVRDQIQEETGLSTVAALEYLAELARSRASDAPECAFVECTRFQAEMHARQITERLGVACAALTTVELDGNRRRVPQHVRTLLTTGFHRGEVARLADPPDLTVAEVPICLSGAFVDEIAARDERLIMMGPNLLVREEDTGDLNRLMGTRRAGATSRAIDPSCLDEELGRVFMGAENQPLVLLSTTLWEAAGRWREDARVMAVRYEILEEGWGLVADAIGLPMGVVG